MNSLSGKTSLFATGPLNRPLFSSIHRMRCTGAIFDITASCRRSDMLPPVARPARSALNFGDPCGRPAAHRQIADALAARRHRAPPALAPPGVKEPLRREPVAVGADSNRRGHDRAQARAQPPDLRRREHVGAAARIDAGLVEHLVGDPVPHARRERLVEQHRLDRRRALAEERRQAAEGRQLVERVEAEQADRRLGARVVAQPHAPEPARVAKRDFGAVVEHQVQFEESGRPDVRMRPAALGHEPAAALATDFDLAGHPEVEARPGTAVELEPQVLAVPVRRQHAASNQRPPHARRAHALEHDRVARDVGRDDSAPHRGAREQAAGGLDLGKLGHRAVVYDEPRARGGGDGRRARVVPFGPAQGWPRRPRRSDEFKEPSMARMTGGEAIVKALAREGVKVAFGLPGVQLYGIVTAFRDEPLRFITVRHEGASTYLADGYARAGGGIGVAVAVPGPGLLNASAGLNTAYSASSPVLLIAGQVPRNQIGKKIGVLHELDNQLDAIAGSTKWRQTIMQVADAPRIVHEAFGQLRSGRPRPVAIDMPWDTMEEEVDVTLPAAGPHPPRAAAPAGDIDRAAEALLRAQRVAIYAGGGVHLSGAHAALAAVAEHLQAGVVETAEGKGANSDASDLSLGAGLFPKSPLRRYLDAADVVLAVGSRCAAAMLQADQQVIQIDADPDEIGRNHKKTSGLVGDAKATLER